MLHIYCAARVLQHTPVQQCSCRAHRYYSAALLLNLLTSCHQPLRHLIINRVAGACRCGRCRCCCCGFLQLLLLAAVAPGLGGSLVLACTVLELGQATQGELRTGAKVEINKYVSDVR